MRFGFHTIHFSPMFGGNGALLDVIAATAAAGFDAIGIDLPSVEAHVETGGSVDQVADAIAGTGLRCTDVLVVVAGVEDDVLTKAETLGALAESIGAPACIAAVGAPVPWPALVRSLRECADILGGHGCRLAIEFTPYSALGTLEEAKRLCGEIGWDNAGLVLDSLHFFRSGAPWDELDDLTPDQLLVVQWNDVLDAPTGSLLDESRNRRLLPGDGTLALTELATAMRGLGFDGTVSAEILSESFRRSDPATAIRATYAALTGPAAGWLTAATG